LTDALASILSKVGSSNSRSSLSSYFLRRINC